MEIDRSLAADDSDLKAQKPAGINSTVKWAILPWAPSIPRSMDGHHRARRSISAAAALDSERQVDPWSPCQRFMLITKAIALPAEIPGHFRTALQ
jgi:hypothetical protein